MATMLFFVKIVARGAKDRRRSRFSPVCSAWQVVLGLGMGNCGIDLLTCRVEGPWKPLTPFPVPHPGSEEAGDPHGAMSSVSELGPGFWTPTTLPFKTV